MRVRIKDCYVCNDAKQVLYRCRYDELKDWMFLCGECLTNVKSRFEDTYQYGGTWKSTVGLTKAELTAMMNGNPGDSTKLSKEKGSDAT